jgi:hypothetical protein
MLAEGHLKRQGVANRTADGSLDDGRKHIVYL